MHFSALSKCIYMLICSGIPSSWKGIGGRLVNCAFSSRATTGMRFLCATEVQTHSCKAVDIIRVDSLHPNNLRTCWSTPEPRAPCLEMNAKVTSVLLYVLEAKSSTQRASCWCPAMWGLTSCEFHPYSRVCLCWHFWMWRYPILATQDDSQDQRYGHLWCESRLWVALSVLEDFWLSPLHMADHPHLWGGKYRVLSWGMPQSLSKGLPSSPASLALITYAHNPWLLRVIHQLGPRTQDPQASPA